MENEEVTKKRGRKKIVSNETEVEVKEVKKRGRKKKEEDVLTNMMNDVEIDDFKIVNEDMKNLTIESEDEKDREERRENKIEIRKLNALNVREVNEETDRGNTYYIYLYGRDLKTRKEIEGNGMISLYQVLLSGVYMEYILFSENKREDIIYEDEFEIIKTRNRYKILIMKDKPCMNEYINGEWKNFLFMYWKNKNFENEKEIRDKINQIEEIYVSDTRTLKFDNTTILNKKIYCKEGDYLIESEITIRDLIINWI